MAEDIQFSPVRVTAATQEAAIEQALAMTGATREQIAVEIIEESAKGVTVRVRPGSGEEPTPATKTPESTAAQPEEDDADEPADAEDDFADADDTDDDDDDVDAAEDDDFDEDDEDDDDEDDDTDTVATEQAAAVPAFDEATVQAAQERAQSLAADLLQRIALDVTCEAVPLPAWMIDPDDTPDVPRVFLKVEGEDVSILIGKRGNTLQAFQYMLNLTLNNRTDEEEEVEDGVHVVVDAGEYRERRAVALQQSAREAAARAKHDRRAVRMEPLNGHERRLIHLALRGDSEVSTSSDGREPWRRVIVTPNNARGGREGGRSDGPRNEGRRNEGGRGESSGNRGDSRGRGGYGSNRGGNRGGRPSNGGGDNRGYGSGRGYGTAR